MAGKIALDSVKRIVLVSSGKGGVGKSTVAANIAVGLSKHGFNVGLLDADFYGPSIPTMFGIKERPRVVNQKIQPIIRHGVRLLSAGMLADPTKAFVWRGPLLRGVLKQFIRDTDWGNLDVLLLDLPPGTGEIQISILNLIDAYGAIVVTTPQDVAQADVRRSLTMLTALRVPILAIVENMATYKCPCCGNTSKVFPGNSGEELAREFNISTLVHLPFWSPVAVHGDSGIPALISEESTASEFGQGLELLIQALPGQ